MIISSGANDTILAMAVMLKLDLLSVVGPRESILFWGDPLVRRFVMTELMTMLLLPLHG